MNKINLNQLKVFSFLLFIILFSSGCTTSMVNKIGKVKLVSYDPCQAFISQNGDIIIKAPFGHGSLDDASPSIDEDKGYRYFILNAKAVREEILEKAKNENNENNEVRLCIKVLQQNTQQNLKEASYWYCYPADVTSNLTKLELPKYLAQEKLTVYTPGSDDTFSKPELKLPYKINSKTYYVKFYGPYFINNVYQMSWGYPYKILFILSVAIDILTAPFQLIGAALALGLTLGQTH